jgi:putative membrane protein
VGGDRAGHHTHSVDLLLAKGIDISDRVICSDAMKWILKLLLSATALVAVSQLDSGVEVSSFASALVAVLVIGLLNIFLRPLMILLTLPVTVISLGLFLFVINALLFWAAANMLDGFQVNGFGSALLGSLIYSAFGLIIDSALERLFPQQ